MAEKALGGEAQSLSVENNAASILVLKVRPAAKLQKKGVWLYRSHILKRSIRGSRAGKWTVARIYGQPIQECGHHKKLIDAIESLDKYLLTTPS